MLRMCTPYIITHAGSSGAANRVINGVCDFVCVLIVLVCVYPHCKRKTALTIHTKLGAHIFYGSGSACSVPEIKRSKVKVT